MDFVFAEALLGFGGFKYPRVGWRLGGGGGVGEELSVTVFWRALLKLQVPSKYGKVYMNRGT